MKVEIQIFGRTVVANNVPEHIDPYDMLDCCDNVEREGEGSYRFDNVSDKKTLTLRLKGKEIRRAIQSDTEGLKPWPPMD